MTRTEELVTIKGRKYRIVYTRPIGRNYCWEAFRASGDFPSTLGVTVWKPIPAMTRSECRRFPKAVAQYAQAKTNELNGVEVQA